MLFERLNIMTLRCALSVVSAYLDDSVRYGITDLASKRCVGWYHR